MENYFIDTHSHIDMIDDISLDEIIKSANDVGVKKIIIPAVNEQDFESKIETTPSPHPRSRQEALFKLKFLITALIKTFVP